MTMTFWAAHRRPAVVASVLAMGAALLVSAPPTAHARPATQADTTQHSAPSTFPLKGVSPGQHVITLVTGDHVTLTERGKGNYSAKIDPAPRNDGQQVVFQTNAGPDHVYVLPSDALPALGAGRLDKRLFDVKYLAENGYADEASKQLPVIVQYPKGDGTDDVKAQAQALPASKPTLTLGSIHSSALKVDKAQADDFWAKVRSTPSGKSSIPSGRSGMAAPSTLGDGLTKLWLDAKERVQLKDSVPLIGAPQAWSAGYDGTGVKVAILDTGIDETHPDLAGKVADARDFVPDDAGVTDHHGHGTHVASIVTGSGAASGGTFKGVAPGVELLVGKVLDDTGSGDESWIIAGMQWAAESGAKVISMSLGSGPADGTDPISQAVNDITAQTGALFVIAAGNSGPGASTVSAPSTADAALSVAATDKSDQLAGFSSRGPRIGDGALKPDIAAPGVAITAARAAGTTLDEPFDDHYVTASGTSMATPHVAGAAAILAQEFPDFSAAQLKAALMSTSKDDGYSPYEQGAGRIDVARAVSQKVYATTPNLDYGRRKAGSSDPIDKQVTYTNLTSSPVTLTLASTLKTKRGDSAPAGALKFSDPTVTVPAGGSASTTITLAPSGLDPSQYSGSVVATGDGGLRLTTPVGVQPPLYDVTIHTVGRDGKPLTPKAQDTIDVSGDNGNLDGATLTDTGTVRVAVPPGTYSITQLVRWTTSDSRAASGLLINPEVAVSADTEITLDARQAQRITFTTPKPNAPLNGDAWMSYQRTTVSGDRYEGTVGTGPPQGANEQLWATPTKPVTLGTFRFHSHWLLGAPSLAMDVAKGRNLALHPTVPITFDDEREPVVDGERPQLVSGFPDWVPFTGTQKLPVVDVGLGRPEDLAGKDLHGKLALMEADLAPGLFGPVCGAQVERIGPVRDAGAAGLVIFPSASSPCGIPLNPTQTPFTGEAKPLGIPFAFVSTTEGLALRDRTAEGALDITVTGTHDIPYTYDLNPYEEGRVPDSLHYTFADRQLAQTDLHIHGDQRSRYAEDRFAFKPDDEVVRSTALSWGGGAYAGPTTRTEYTGPLDPDVLHQIDVRSSGPSIMSRTFFTAFDHDTRTRQDWHADPLTPGAASISGLSQEARSKVRTILLCSVCRRGNLLIPWFYMNGGVGNGFTDYGISLDGETFRNFDQHLYLGDKEIAQTPIDGVLPTFPLPDETGTYRLTVHGPRTDTAWTFTSSKPSKDTVQPGYFCPPTSDAPCEAEPAVFASYDVGSTLNPDNTADAGPATITVNAYHSPSPNPMPPIAGVKLWTSTDDGAHWTAAKVTNEDAGTYTASVTYPATTGTVSLKVEAWDTAGNRVEQTSHQAIRLSGRH